MNFFLQSVKLVKNRIEINITTSSFNIAGMPLKPNFLLFYLNH